MICAILSLVYVSSRKRRLMSPSISACVVLFSSRTFLSCKYEGPRRLQKCCANIHKQSKTASVLITRKGNRRGDEQAYVASWTAWQLGDLARKKGLFGRQKRREASFITWTIECSIGGAFVLLVSGGVRYSEMMVIPFENCSVYRIYHRSRAAWIRRTDIFTDGR